MDVLSHNSDTLIRYNVVQKSNIIFVIRNICFVSISVPRYVNDLATDRNVHWVTTMSSMYAKQIQYINPDSCSMSISHWNVKGAAKNVTVSSWCCFGNVCRIGFMLRCRCASYLLLIERKNCRKLCKQLEEFIAFGFGDSFIHLRYDFSNRYGGHRFLPRFRCFLVLHKSTGERFAITLPAAMKLCLSLSFSVRTRKHV